MRTTNPVLNEKAFSGVERAYDGPVMTISGTVNKAFLLLFMIILTASYTWFMYFKTQSAASLAPWMLVGGIGGFVIAIVTAFKKEWSPITAPIYAFCEGLFIGGISAIYETATHGIVIMAASLTFGTLFTLLFVYKAGIIRATENFKLGVVAATGGIALVYIATMVLGLFHVQVPMIYGGGMLGIGFSLFVVVVAALNLVLDFDFIENGANRNLPAYMEWYAAFGLMVTLIWLYLEILRLLSKFSRK